MKNTIKTHIDTYQILLIDDEPNILKALSREIGFWASDKDLEIHAFKTPIDAMRHLQIHHEEVFLVISDLRMPLMKGSDLLQTIHTLYPQIRLFLLTAYTDISEIQKAISASIDQLIIKPWENAELTEMIEDSLQKFKDQQKEAHHRSEVRFSVKEAGDFQKSLFSSSHLKGEHIDIDVLYLPVENFCCGGDYYEVVELSENRKALFMADVSGHGIRPAFVTAMLKVLSSTIRPQLNNKKFTTADICSSINKDLFTTLQNVSDIIVSYTAALIDYEAMTLQISNAGSPFTYISREGGLEELENHGIPLGFQPDSSYSTGIHKLQKGDKIILFTDGLVESEKKHEKMKQSLIKKTLSEIHWCSHLAQEIYDHFQELQEQEKPADDVTIISASIL